MPIHPLLILVTLLKDFMPYETHPPTGDYEPSDALPQHLDHKPVFALPYEAFDGQYAGETDVRYVSIGIAQYDAEQVSIKTMRHTGTKWTRQAEELPIHRPIDMTLFLAKALFDAQNGVVTIPAGTFENQSNEITITPEQRNFGELATYNAVLSTLAPAVRARLNALRDVLNDLKVRDRI